MAAVRVHDAIGGPHGGMRKIQLRFGLPSVNTARQISSGRIKITNDGYKNCGRKRKLDADDMLIINEVLKDHKYDMTWDDLSETLKTAVSPLLIVSPVTLWRECVHRRKYKQCAKHVKPFLTEAQGRLG